MGASLRAGKPSAEDVHAAFGLIATYVLAFLLAYGGYRKKSLSKTGAIAAFLVGALTMSTGFEFGLALVLFFYSSSMMTKLHGRRKRHLEDGHKEGGQRNWEQVVANSLFACMLCILHRVSVPWKTVQLLRESGAIVDFVNPQFIWHSFVFTCFLGFYSCTNGDTWASEIGILFSKEPFLITGFRRVPRGTNGGVSIAGTLASIFAGVFIGLPFVLLYPSSWKLLILTAACSFLGSIFDSILGGLFQYSGYCPMKRIVVNEPTPFAQHVSGHAVLNNHQVNFLSAAITSVLAGFMGIYIMS
eukprot:ANDGO_03632.mRNA.1 VTE6-related protein At5g19930